MSQWCRATVFCKSKWHILDNIVQFCHDFPSWKCRTVSRLKSLWWLTSSRHEVLFCSKLTDENYSAIAARLIFDATHSHTHTPQSSKSNHSCLTGSTPCFLLPFPQGYLAYSWPLIPTEKHIRREMKPTEVGGKKRSISPYFLSTGDNGQSQWTNPKLPQYEQQWSSSARIPACLTDWAADIKHYWIFPKTWTAGFWNLIQMMKAVLKIGGREVLQMFQISGLKF